MALMWTAAPTQQRIELNCATHVFCTLQDHLEQGAAFRDRVVAAHGGRLGERELRYTMFVVEDRDGTGGMSPIASVETLARDFCELFQSKHTTTRLAEPGLLAPSIAAHAGIARGKGVNVLVITSDPNLFQSLVPFAEGDRGFQLSNTAQDDGTTQE